MFLRKILRFAQNDKSAVILNSVLAWSPDHTMRVTLGFEKKLLADLMGVHYNLNYCKLRSRYLHFPEIGESIEKRRLHALVR